MKKPSSIPKIPVVYPNGVTGRSWGECMATSVGRRDGFKGENFLNAMNMQTLRIEGYLENAKISKG